MAVKTLMASTLSGQISTSSPLASSMVSPKAAASAALGGLV